MASDIRDFSDEQLEELENWLLSTWDRNAPPDFKLDEIIIAGEHGRGVPRNVEEELQVKYIVDHEDLFVLEGSEEFRILADVISEFERPQPPEFVMQNFQGVDLAAIPQDAREEGISSVVNVRTTDPNRVYSLTDNDDLVVSGEGVVREQPEQLDLQGLRDRLIRLFNVSIERLASMEGNELAREAELDSIFITQSDINDRQVDDVYITVDRVPNGLESMMKKTLYPELEQEEGIKKLSFEELKEIIEEEEHKYGIFNIHTFKSSIGLEGIIRGIAEDGEETNVTLLDLLNDQEAELEDHPTIPGSFNEVVESADIIDEEEDREETPKPELEQEEDVEEPSPEEVREMLEEEEEDEEEDIGPEFPEVPGELQDFGIDEDRSDVRVPLNKDSIKVQSRPLYDFEKELLTRGEADTSIEGTIDGGIGEALDKEALGMENKKGEFYPPASFPRTGNYIKNYLFYEGVSFPLELHREMAVYSAYISAIHNGRYVIGSYQSMREYIYKLKQIPERGGPELIEELSQPQVAARGLSVIPELPSGEEAPWLEKKSYIDVIEENMNHPAWNNPSDYIYGE